jgi:hypothetical protein
MKGGKSREAGGSLAAGARRHPSAVNPGHMERSSKMTIGTILLILVILILVGALPT